MNTQLLFIGLSLLAGIMIPFQSAMNAQLGKALQSPYYSAITVFVVAFVGLLVYILLNRMPLPHAAAFQSAPTWSYLGGVLGGIYILLIVLCAPKIGIGNATVMVLLGQILAAVVIDHFGLLNATPHPINWQRLAGVVLLVLGVYIVKKY